MTARHAGQHGFTLLELLIASALGLVVLMTATEMLVSARQVERLDRAQARVHDSARFATGLIARALREAGYPGCHPAFRRNLLIDGADPAWPPADVAAGIAPAAAGDALVIRRMRSLGRARILAPPATDEHLPLDRDHGIRTGQTVMVAGAASADCVLFRQTAAAPDMLDRGPGVESLNRIPSEGYRPIAGEVEILTPERTVFYVDEAVGRPGVRSLYRRRDSRGGRREELIVGVEQLQLRLGLDETTDGYVDRYVPAAQRPAGADVVAVRVDLLVTSQRAPGVLDAPMRLESGDAAPDRRLYEPVTLTVALRNRHP